MIMRQEEHEAVTGLGETEGMVSWSKWTLRKFVGRDVSALWEFTEEELIDLRQEAAGVVSRLDTLLALKREQRPAIERPARDTMLNPNEAAKAFDVKPRWLLERADAIPGTRRLSAKTIRFSEKGLTQYMNGKRKAAG